MNIKGKVLAVVAAVIFGIFYIGSANLSAESGLLPDSKPVAEEMLGSSGITWSPKISYARLTVTVARPDGSAFTKTFDSGGTPYLDFSEIMGQDFTDGIYTYELWATPEIGRRVRGDLEVETRAYLAPEGLNQTGYFMVRGGSIVTNNAGESIAAPQTLISDNLYVQGSLCVGIDCVNNESFGFDTIRLKENNLRIHFQDTSSSASFPTNDWRIIVNDSSNGGASYFAVEDSDAGTKPFTVRAGAGNNALYVDNQGDLGLGTSTPVLELQITDGDTPGVRLEQNGSSGWTPQTWDVAGNETNFFIRDVSNSSYLPFRIQPGTPSNTLTLKSDGKVGIGTWSPAAQFEIETTGKNAAVIFERTDGATGKFTARPNEVYIGSGSDHNVKIVGNNNVVMTLQPSGNVGIGLDPTHLLHLSGGAYSDGTTWQNASSIAFKENVRSLDGNEAMSALNALNPVKFNYKTNKLEEYVGFIAEEVPELVATNGRKGLSPMDIVAVLTRVVQQQQKTISTLNTRIDDLENRLQSEK